MTASKPPVRLLLVEDNPDDADILTAMLDEATSGGFSVTNAESLAECLSLLQAPGRGGSFDLVLLDLSLPDSVGLETLRQVLSAAGRVPVVLLTGMDDEALGVEALYAGAQDYLVKGRIEVTGIMRAIRYAIERKRIEEYKDDLLSLISHELRTPMHQIVGNATLLKSELVGPLNDRQRHHLDLLLAGAERMGELIEELLDNALIRSGRVELSPTPVEYADVVGEAVGLIRNRAEMAGVGLDVRIEGSISLRIDARRMVQVLSNLLTNAIKFTPRGGQISIRARQEPGGLLTEVIDTGVGLQPEVAARVFDRFYQADMTASRPAGGIGLGLAMSKAVVEAHGGTIGVESQPGSGSTFWFLLPSERLATPAASGREDGRADGGSPGG